MPRKATFKADPNDFIVVVMGPTGAGKSNFINAITGNEEASNARNLQSDTKDVTPYIIQHDGGVRVVLVDTPGFDDTYRPDQVILRIIADWLTQKYSSGNTLRACGIVYLHRITDKRVSGSTLKNLRMFGGLCGDIPLHRVRLVTTMWDTVKSKQTAMEAAEKREVELKDDFWKELLRLGAQTKRFENTRDSAWGIIKELLDKGKEGDELLLQEELVEQHKRLNETEAAKVLYSQLQNLLVEQKTLLKELTDNAKTENNPTLTTSMQQEYERVNATLQKTFGELKEMKVPLSRRITLWLFKRKSRGRAVKLSQETLAQEAPT